MTSTLKMTGRLLLLSASVASMCAARAAQSPPQDRLAEIVVTAEKTPEVLARIPASISVISGKALAQAHVTGYSGLSRVVPDLSFSSGGGPGQDNIEIRGVSSQAGSSTTGIYLDNVPIDMLNIYTSGATEPRFFDIKQVEVLRGPQGTLYGASSMGGTILFVSNPVNLYQAGGFTHSSVGGTEGGGINYETDSALDLPLKSGVAALRIGGLYDHESGYIDRIAPNGTTVGRNINDTSTAVAQVKLEWRPSKHLTVTPALFVQRLDAGGQNTFAIGEPLFTSTTLVPESSRDEFGVASLTVQYDLGWSELTAVSGYFWRRDDRMIDGTSYDSGYIGYLLQQQLGYGGSTIGALAAPAAFNTNVNQINEEVRLASKPGAGRLSWIAGLYYSRNRTVLLDDEHIPGFNSTFQAVYHDTPLNVLGAAFPNDLVYYADTHFVDSDKAVFGQATYRITHALKLTAGLRYEKASETLGFTSAGYFASGPAYAGSAGGTASSPKAALTYQVNKQTIVYASAAKGYRDGGINRPVPVPLCSGDLAQLGLTQAPPSYKSDSLWSYELGTKTHTADGQTEFNGSVYDIVWTNIQTDILLPTCTFDIKDNIGSAQIRGAEMSLTHRFGAHWTAHLSGNYTSAKITRPVTILGVQRGDHVPGVPLWQISTLLNYGTRVAAGMRGFANLDGEWTGPSQGTIIHGDPDFRRPIYFVLGGSTGVRLADFQFELFVTNLLNTRRIIQRPNIAGVEYGITVRPRTFGLSGTYWF